MALDIIFLVDGSEDSLERFQKYKRRVPHAKKFKTDLTGIQAYKAAGKTALTSNFYLIDHGSIVDKAFDFNFTPDEYNKKFIHIWRYIRNDGTLIDTGIFMFHKPSLRTEETELDKIGDGFKYIKTEVPVPPEEKISIVFLSYDEPNADANWQALKARFPYAKRVHKVRGILNAHKAAADISTTDNFYIVDGDSDILTTFDFSFKTSEYDLERYVHIWKSLNPINGLEYGYGGVKLFHKSMFETIGYDIVDMSTLLGEGVKLIDDVASITRFDSSDFHTFRSAFRECSKLSSGIIKNANNAESLERLDVWTSEASGKYANWALLGATLGKQYGTEHANDVEALGKINDFRWLYNIFRKEKMDQNEKDLLYNKYNKIDVKTITNLTNLLYNDASELTLEELRDCLSVNELLSKFWIIDELNKLGLNKDLEMLIIDGAYGTLANFLFQFYYQSDRIKKILSLDTDGKFEKIADHLNIDNVINGWRFKAATADPYRLNYEKTEGSIRDGDESKYVFIDWNVLIAPHLERIWDVGTWSNLIPKGKFVVAQSNNFDFEKHDQDHFAKFKKDLDLSEVLYEGIMPCHVYDRYMIIGIK